METQYINLNMTPIGVTPTFHISQYDVGRILGFIVHSGGATVDLDTYTCTIEATRSDGTAITANVTTTDNVGTFETTATMTNKADKYKGQLVITQSGKRVASLPFIMDVCEAGMDENSEAIEEDAPLYQQYNAAMQAALVTENNERVTEDTILRNDLNAEAVIRANADSAEALARSNADTLLQGNITAEATARANADSALGTRIDEIIAPSGEAPSAAEVTDARIGYDGTVYSTLGGAIRGQISDLDIRFLLEAENIPDTTQSLVYGSDGNISTVYHKNSSNVAIRTDVFTFTDASITEVRTLSSGESLTIVTNLSTLATTVTYAAA